MAEIAMANALNGAKLLSIYRDVERIAGRVAIHHVLMVLYGAFALTLAASRNTGVQAWLNGLNGVVSFPFTLAFALAGLGWAYKPKGIGVLICLLPLILFGLVSTIYTLALGISSLATGFFFVFLALLVTVLYQQRWRRFCLRHVLSVSMVLFGVALCEFPDVGVSGYVVRQLQSPAAVLFFSAAMFAGAYGLASSKTFTTVLFFGAPLFTYLVYSFFWSIRTPAAGFPTVAVTIFALTLFMYGGLRLPYYLHAEG